ncbi:LacI family DNA-binding transcriptional regulator [Domibacillus iocasae]|uniref:LacI family transcriptional regulator n=1 Tax=Domibacillus iocasae TaxID=1714016 RepID=A0A1E7DUD1_9BACI|nr:LacI family DNA-binding transcriptional regulator [Domibacillus iocasae]OES46690.1 LacI family transcriptional regulator [Domibacillus iocasae]
MAKMSDVAELAGVSTATVSRVLRSPEAVKEATQKKVYDAIRQLDYQPNMLARNLRINKTGTLLVVAPDLNNLVFSEMIAGIDEEAGKCGYQVLLGNTHGDAKKIEGYIDQLKQKQVDGLILLSVELDEKVWQDITDHYPIVIASDYVEAIQVPTISIDNVACGKQITNHFIQMGHSKIGFIGGRLQASVSRDRLNGYKQALVEAKIAIQDLWIEQGDYSILSGYNLCLKMMNGPNTPTAIFCGSDEMAFGAIKALREKGYRVPEDVAVAGFDDIKFAAVMNPALTTIAQPLQKMGQKAMEVLYQLINGQVPVQKQYIIECEFKIRESCGYHLK